MARTKQRKKGRKYDPDFVPSGGVFSQASSFAHLSVSPPGSPSLDAEANRTHITRSQMDGATSSSEARPPFSSLGHNRLATGFRSVENVERILGDHSTAQDESSSAGDTPLNAIEISDDEGEVSEEGGMVLNLEKGKDLVCIRSLRDAAYEDNFPSNLDSDADVGVQSLQETLRRSSMLDAQTSAQQKITVQPVTIRLKDLNPDDLEQQLKYGYYHLERHRIDLDRPVICLSCFGEGHLSLECPEFRCHICSQMHLTRLCPNSVRCSQCRETGHKAADCMGGLRNNTIPCDLCRRLGHVEEDCAHRFFPPMRNTTADAMKLWISCCMCGSKQHLVGDCPDADPGRAARWSLKDLNPANITNLSLHSGTRKLERQAENRNMRPEGIQIKGRAGLHHAGTAPSGPNHDEEESFLGPPAKMRKPNVAPSIRVGNTDSYKPNPRDQASRYDRFNPPPAENSDRRSRNDWYATDSFGRQRSRSPSFRRPESDGRDRDASSSNTWRPSPPPSDHYRPAYDRNASRRGTDVQKPTAKWNNWQNDQRRKPHDTRAGSWEYVQDFNNAAAVQQVPDESQMVQHHAFSEDTELPLRLGHKRMRGSELTRSTHQGMLQDQGNIGIDLDPFLSVTLRNGRKVSREGSTLRNASKRWMANQTRTTHTPSSTDSKAMKSNTKSAVSITSD